MKSERIVSPVETIDSWELRTFFHVADLRSVTRAAAKVGTSKSTVSKAITALEHKLGVELLARSSRRIEVTESGRMLLARARSLLSDLDILKTDLRALRDDVRGRLTIAVAPDLAAVLTLRLFPAFLRAFPDVTLSLRVAYSFADMQDPALDVAIRVGTVLDDRLVARPVGQIHRILVASPQFLSHGRLATLKDLASAPALIFGDEPGGTVWALTQGRKRAAVSVSGPLSAASFPVLLRAAEAGLGVTLVPELLAQPFLRGGTLVRVLPAWSQGDAPLYLVHRVGHSRLRRVEAFLTFFEKGLRAQPVDRLA